MNPFTYTKALLGFLVKNFNLGLGMDSLIDIVPVDLNERWFATGSFC